MNPFTPPQADLGDPIPDASVAGLTPAAKVSVYLVVILLNLSCYIGAGLTAYFGGPTYVVVALFLAPPAVCLLLLIAVKRFGLAWSDRR